MLLRKPEKEQDKSFLYEFFEFAPIGAKEVFVTKRLEELTKEYGLLLDNPPVIIDPSSYVGIEVEVEQFNPTQIAAFASTGILKNIWTVAEDGSLRNGGLEFISVPLRGKNIFYAISALKQMLEKIAPKYEFTERTSIHVHLNARKLTLEQLLSFLSVYMMVEKVLFKFVEKCGFVREGNIFCVPLGQAKYYLNIANLFYAWNMKEGKGLLDYLVHMWRKYSSLNFIPLAKFGTIEFRHMGGTLDLNLLMNWINIILSLKKYVYKVRLHEILEEIERINTTSQYDVFLNSVFGRYAYLLRTDDLSSRIEDGVIEVKSSLVTASKLGQQKIERTKETLFSSSAMEFFKQLGYTIVETSGPPSLKDEYQALLKEYNAIEDAYNDAIPIEGLTMEQTRKRLRDIREKLTQIYYKAEKLGEEVE